MSNTVYDGAEGVQIDTYTGPDDDGRPRARIQISALPPDGGDRQILQLDLNQWADLCTGIRKISGDRSI